ncbi:MAG: hypothetical protein GEU73_16165 [Chloroflexi bacterium]|nr:hypothetical protein [Chloroflexota bacterium]
MREELRVDLRAAFLGVRAVPPLLLVTPLRRIYCVLAETLELREGPRGWWPAAFSDAVGLVQCPQSSAAADAVHVVDPGTRVVFVGLGGTLVGDPVGVVAHARSASIAGGGRWSLAGAEALPPLACAVARRVVTVDSIATALEEAQRLRWHADIVDLESGHLAGAARGAGHRLVLFSSILIVSDDAVAGDIARCEPQSWLRGLEAAANEIREALSGRAPSADIVGQ